MRLFRRKEQPWELVERRSVEPVPMYYDDEDLDISFVADADTCGTYVFDLKHIPKNSQLSNALRFAQQLVLQEIAKKGFNVLLLESWTLALHRRGKHHRIEVQYSGRPAEALGKVPLRRPPPYISLFNTSNVPPTP